LYAEQPDPHYEQNAISLNEAKLAHASELSEHPSLAGRPMPHSPLKKRTSRTLRWRVHVRGRPAQFTEWQYSRSYEEFFNPPLHREQDSIRAPSFPSGRRISNITRSFGKLLCRSPIQIVGGSDITSGWDKCLDDGRAAGGLPSDGSIVWKVSRV
jgi:hypothetical protein